MTAWALILGGLAAFCLVHVHRSDPARGSWADDWVWRMTLGYLAPCFSLSALCWGLVLLGDPTPTLPLSITQSVADVAAVPAIALLLVPLLAILGVPMPRWMLPTWAHDRAEAAGAGGRR